MERSSSKFTIFYALAAAGILSGYLATEARGIVFTGTDQKVNTLARTSGSGSVTGTRPLSGWGFSGGFSGGK